MLKTMACAPLGDADQDQVLAYLIDELTLAIGLVEDAELHELAGPLRLIFDEAQRELGRERDASLTP